MDMSTLRLYVPHLLGPQSMLSTLSGLSLQFCSLMESYVDCRIICTMALSDVTEYTEQTLHVAASAMTST